MSYSSTMHPSNETIKKQIAKIAEAGNKPEDWKSYIDDVKLKAQAVDDSKRNCILSYLYFSALKVTPKTNKSPAHAQMLVDYAWIKMKSGQSEADAENLLSYGRCHLRQFAIIHIASAELMLKLGKKEQAKKVLKAAYLHGAEPLSMVKEAAKRLCKGYHQLQSDEDKDSSSSSGHESSEPEMSGEYSGSYFRSNIQGQLKNQENSWTNLPILKLNTEELQEGFDLFSRVKEPENNGCPTNGSQDDDSQFTSPVKGYPQEEEGASSSSSLVMPKTPKTPAFSSYMFKSLFNGKRKPGNFNDETFNVKAEVSDGYGEASEPRVDSKCLRENSGLLNLVTPCMKKRVEGIHEPVSSQKLGRTTSASKLKGFQLQPPRRVKVEMAAKLDFENENKGDENSASPPAQAEIQIKSIEQGHQAQSALESSSKASSNPAPLPVGPASSNVHTKGNEVVNCIESKTGQKIIRVNNKPYIVTRLIGRGGSAKVYQVQDPSSLQMKALKRVNLSDATPQILDSFKNEIALLKKLQGCDCVIHLYDSEYEEDNKKLLVVMEYGETDLANFIAKNGSIKNQDELYPVTVCYLWGNMVKAVRAMHKEGVIHSDLKPANFILVSGNIKLIDFGIANSIQQDKTSMLKDHTIGTPSFMSPEALMANNSADSHGKKPVYKVGFKSDVWSLGCILYQMVYGQTPFQNCRYKLEAIVNPAHVINFPETNDEALTDILKKCLTRDVKERPTTEQLMMHPYLTKQRAEETPPITDPISKLMSEGANIATASPRSQQAFCLKFQKAMELMNSTKKAAPVSRMT